MPAKRTLPWLKARPPRTVPYEQIVSLEVNPAPPPPTRPSSTAHVVSQTHQPQQQPLPYSLPSYQYYPPPIYPYPPPQHHHPPYPNAHYPHQPPPNSQRPPALPVAPPPQPSQPAPTIARAEERPPSAVQQQPQQLPTAETAHSPPAVA